MYHILKITKLILLTNLIMNNRVLEETLIVFTIGATSLSVASAISAGYAYKTKFTKQITIDEKFEQVNGNKDRTRQLFHVSDTEKNIYKVVPSVWYWKWHHTETWNNMKKGETYNVIGYGYRIGILNIYPNIISIEQISNNTTISNISNE